MPRPYPVHYEDRGQLAEQLTGLGDLRRATKTNLPGHAVAMLTSLVKSDAEDIAHTLRQMHEAEFNEDLTDEQLCSLYPEISEWRQLHQNLVEHFSSVEGFMVNRVTAGQEEEERRERKAESSGETKERKKWSN